MTVRADERPGAVNRSVSSGVGARPGADRPRAQRQPIRIPRPARHLALAVVVVCIGGLAGLLPFNTRAQQDDTYAQSLQRLERLDRENAALTAQRDLLQTDEEVARIAREEFGLAPTDATVYAIPELRPDNGDRDRTGAGVASAVESAESAETPKRGLGDRIIDFIVFWD